MEDCRVASSIGGAHAWSWKSDLTSKKKPCSEMGIVVRVLEPPFSRASSIARRCGSGKRDCNSSAFTFKVVQWRFLMPALASWSKSAPTGNSDSPSRMRPVRVAVHSRELVYLDCESATGSSKDRPP